MVENNNMKTACGDAIIARLMDENERLRESLKIGVEWMEFWLNEDICDCEDGVHICGRNEREKELRIMKQALEGA